MKTFEEAIRMLSQPCATQSEVKQKLQEMGATVQRYTDLAQEIAHNDDARALITTFCKPGSSQSVKEAIMNVFIQGVMVGIEMEKQELDAGSIKK